MNILLTGSTGYIGRRLLPVLVKSGHTVICLVRDERRFDYEDFDSTFLENVKVVEGDLSNYESLADVPKNIDAAYYLVHSLGAHYKDFSETEELTARNFSKFIKTSSCKQIIYLGGISNDENLSDHLNSRKNVESVLEESGVPITVLRAAIIIGSGGASFEIIRDLVEKLPVMVAPKWINTKCQPIAIRNVLQYLEGVLLNEKSYHKIFDIGGPEVLTYKQMLMKFAESRRLKRWIIPVPVLSPNLSSRWLYFVTSTSFNLARNLVDSMMNEVVCQHQGIDDIVEIKKFTYPEALKLAFQKIDQKDIISSWKDSPAVDSIETNFLDNVNVPTDGCLFDKKAFSFERDPEEVKENIWQIGGNRGWYYGTFLWKIRGFLDQLFGGVGLRRGRRSPVDLKPGDALDFWRVLMADKEKCKLLLYAEMKLPGEAWLEFRIKNIEGKNTLIQNATFRPRGLWGRIYWFSVLPFHFFIFNGMAKSIISYQAA
ncbi:MAG: SDR family oxidoreductase [Bacteroidota bacterium]